ncbi:MAG: hypothetical protein PHF35_02655 [Candidatus Moranbacteria bacterium]|nr:hypothetical protein [Candidatus Moranbacteria bacterium]
MSHICEAVLITCMDFRLHQRKDGRNYIADYIQMMGIDCDLVTRAGGILDLLNPAKNSFADSILRDANVSHQLHSAHTLLFINHEDCGAYGQFKFKTRHEEIRKHETDLRWTLKTLHLLFPEKRIIGSFAELENGTTDVFNIHKVFQYMP